jgi:hypothetical protein
MMAAARTAATATPAAVADEDEAEPVRTAVLYEAWLEHADESQPLWRVPYFGQVVRVGTAEEVFAARKREHETDAAREDKDLGFHAVLDRFGPDAMEWRIVSSETGPRAAMQALANAEEIRLIDENGGVLQDMDAKRKQTLNLAKGGQGDARAVWAGIDARRRRALTKFQAAMVKYVEVHDSALVPQDFVDEDGCRLGQQLSGFRQGDMRKGLPEEKKINAWAEALPNWHWDARESDAYREGFAQRGRERSRGAYEAFQVAMQKYVEAHGDALVPREYVDDDDAYPLGVRLKSFRQGKMRKGTPWEDAAKAWAEALPGWHWDARESDAFREGFAQRGKDQAANETAEQKADRLAKTKTTMATDASQAKRREISTNQWTNASEEQRTEWRQGISDSKKRERRAELERARSLAVPFEKSKKRRAELRAASTDFSGKKGNAVLHMVSEDGATIRRVDKEGMMRNRDIVGPVVDPPPVAEAGPSDLNAYVSESESD